VSDRDRRASERVRINREFASVERFIAEYAADISRDGCFIRSRHPLPVGTEVELYFTVIESDLELIKGVGEVVRVIPAEEEGAGMGVRFVELESDADERIRALIER
jgi:uncharacterized protein (TIGR02266 family)